MILRIIFKWDKHGIYFKIADYLLMWLRKLSKRGLIQHDTASARIPQSQPHADYAYSLPTMHQFSFYMGMLTYYINI